MLPISGCGPVANRMGQAASKKREGNVRHSVSRYGCVLLIGATLIPAPAQTTPAFEVASVKLDKTAHEPRFQVLPSGRVSVVGYSLRMLVALSITSHSNRPLSGSSVDRIGCDRKPTTSKRFPVLVRLGRK